MEIVFAGLLILSTSSFLHAEENERDLSKNHRDEFKELKQGFVTYAKEGDIRVDEKFMLTDEGKAFCADANISIPQYLHICGNAIQRCLHKQFVENINDLGSIHAGAQHIQTKEFCYELAKINSVGVQKTKRNDDLSGFRILKFCKKGIEYVKYIRSDVYNDSFAVKNSVCEKPGHYTALVVDQIYASKELLAHGVLSLAYELSRIETKKLARINFNDVTIQGIFKSLHRTSEAFAERIEAYQDVKEFKKMVDAKLHIYFEHKLTQSIANFYNQALRHDIACLNALKSVFIK